MKHDPKLFFAADTRDGKLTIRRDFAAPRPLVWDCHTKVELLEKWFAPKPLTTKTAHFDFSEGGTWHYAMVMEDGTEYWGLTEYKTITPIEGYTTRDYFADASGTPNADLPGADWVVRFEDGGDKTTVRTKITYASADDLQKVIDMGMEEGITSTFETLDDLLATLSN